MRWYRIRASLISGLDWFPTFVAAAGNLNVVEELKRGKQVGDRNYKVHLDGYNQMGLITGKGPSKRNEVFYFAEGTLGAVRIGDYKYRFIDAQRLDVLVEGRRWPPPGGRGPTCSCTRNEPGQNDSARQNRWPKARPIRR
jgi:arylsulfatase A-like enzyme